MYLPIVFWDVIDILILAFILYRAVMFFAETRAMRLAMGIMVLVVTSLLAVAMGFEGLLGIFERFDYTTAGVVILAVLFTPEIRDVLARAAPLSRFREIRLEEKRVIQEVVRACERFQKKSLGALMVLQREDGLGDYIRSGVSLDSRVSAPLLESIFSQASPLHDGAVVIKENRLIAAKCILPLSDAMELKREGVGTRHRAAVGLSEHRDAVAVVVSEERGTVSMAARGNILKFDDLEKLQEELLHLFVEPMKATERARRFDMKQALLLNLRWKLAAILVAAVFWSFQVQNVPVVASIVIPPETGYPKPVADITDRDPVIVNPESLETGTFHLRGQNWKLYAILWGALTRGSGLEGTIKIDFDKTQPEDMAYVPKFDYDPSYLGKEVVVWDPQERAPKKIHIVVARVASIPKAKIKIQVTSQVSNFQAEDTYLDFEDPERNLFCRLRERDQVLRYLENCPTDRPIRVTAADLERDPIDFKDVRLQLPDPIRNLAINEGQDRVRQVIISVRPSEPDEVVDRAIGEREERRKDTERREQEKKELLDEIALARTAIPTEAFRKKFTMTDRENRLRQLEILEQEINDWTDRIQANERRVQEYQKTIDDSKKLVLEAKRDSPERKAAADAQGKASYLRNVHLKMGQYLRSYRDSTDQMAKEVREFVRALDLPLEPAIAKLDQARAKSAEVESAREALEAAEAAVRLGRHHERHEGLIQSLQSRPRVEDLPTDPAERLDGIAGLLLDDVLGKLALERTDRLKDAKTSAKEVFVQVKVVEQFRARVETEEFLALAEMQLRLGEKTLELQEVELEIDLERARFVQGLYEEARQWIEPELDRIAVALAAIEKTIEERKGALSEELSARLAARGRDLTGALENIRAAQGKLAGDRLELEGVLARIDGDMQELPVEPEAGAPDLRPFIEDELTAVENLDKHLEQWSAVIDKQLGLLEGCARLSARLVPPKPVGEAGGDASRSTDGGETPGDGRRGIETPVEVPEKSPAPSPTDED